MRDGDRALLDIIRDAEASIQLELYGLKNAEKIGGKVRRDQLLQAQASMNRTLEKMWLEIGDQVQAGKAAAAAAAIESMVPETWLRAVMPDADVDYLMRSARLTAQRGIDVAEARLNLSRIPLAESVYNNAQLSSGFIDEIVNSALAGGLSAAELAKNVSSFINPDVRGGVKYAAMRLGRTELNNAFHATQVQQGIKTPWTTGMKWNLSGSHTVPDECNDYADSEHYPGGEAGVFLPGDVPGKPHPNCLCYMTPVVDDREAFIRKLESGDYDDYLDEEFGLDPSSRFSARAPRVDTPTPAPKAGPVAPAQADVPPAFADLNTMQPLGYADARKLANNKTSSAAPYNNNCHYVVNAVEMRARGYDVVAAPTYKSEGRYFHSISKDWRDPTTGAARKPEYAVPRKGEADIFAAVERVTDDWPLNSRGFVEGEWTRHGGGHIFSVYKDSTGHVRFVDGQNGKADASSYLPSMKKIRLMRVDDLEPVPERVRLSVENEHEKITKTTQGVRLKNLLEQLDKDRYDATGPYHQAYTQSYFDLYDEARKAGVV
jgi:hypothetical protein